MESITLNNGINCPDYVDLLYIHQPAGNWLAQLREEYDLHMTAERYRSTDAPDPDDRFLRK